MFKPNINAKLSPNPNHKPNPNHNPKRNSNLNPNLDPNANHNPNRNLNCNPNSCRYCNGHYKREILAAMGDQESIDELEKARRSLHDVRQLSKAMAQSQLEDAVTRQKPTRGPSGGPPGVHLSRTQKKRARNKRQATLLLSQSRLLALKHLLDAMGGRTLYTKSISTFKVR